MANASQFSFHLSFFVHSLAAARQFYGEILGCNEGRSSSSWVDFDLYGHQLSLHQREGYRAALARGDVDSEAVPMPHFGIILDQSSWETLARRLTHAEQIFVIEPHTRFIGQAGEQSTMFLLDPSGNALEFKGFRNLEKVFATIP